jgi:hypothetical protein
MRTKNIDFTGKNIFVGLDVHKKSWSVTVLLDEIDSGTSTTSLKANILNDYLQKNTFL